MLLADAALRHVASKYLELLLVPAAADNLTTPGASTSITAGLSSQCWRERVDAPLSPAAALGYAHLRANWSGRDISPARGKAVRKKSFATV